MTSDTTPRHPAILVLPRLRIQNANAISSPMTWGFPAITAFTGFMIALERRLGTNAGIGLNSVGVICHHFQAQVSQTGYTRSFCLTRNPVLSDGSSAALVEEGRAHLEVTLVFDAQVSDHLLGAAKRQATVEHLADLAAGMRIAGGSVMPPLNAIGNRSKKAECHLKDDNSEDQAKIFSRLARQWLPGFALVLRDDLLLAHHATLKASSPSASLLEAWLDFARLTYRATEHPDSEEMPGEGSSTCTWSIDNKSGWLVPIPVGYRALGPMFDPGEVVASRDPRLPFFFVESIYSVGQWISPNRLRSMEQLVWFDHHDESTGLYRSLNYFQDSDSSF